MAERVWVLQPCDYDEYGIEGVFATPEAAKAHYPELEWSEEHNGEWYNLGAASARYRVYVEEVRS